MSIPKPPTVGIIADDMTGALDSAARLSPLAGPIPLEIATGNTTGSSFAVSSNTREAKSTAEAAGRVAQLASRLVRCDIAFKKIDSLMRGQPFAELAAVMSAADFDRCLFAPAFPEQGRVTVDGRQWVVAANGERRPVGMELIAAAETEGLAAVRACQDFPEAVQIIIADAEVPADLTDAIRTVQALGGRCLYCGTAGLAGALADCRPPRVLTPDEPILAIVGSPHPVSRAQVEAAEGASGAAHCGFGTDPAARLMTIHKNCLISFSFDQSIDRVKAQDSIRIALQLALQTQPRPASLLVVGGETLATVADLLAVEQITAEGELAPGLPAGRLEGGVWSGVRFFSKSGAFGEVNLLRRVLLNQMSDLLPVS